MNSGLVWVHEAILHIVLVTVFACYLAALENAEHERQANRQQLLSVLILLDGAEVSEQRQHDRGSGLKLSAAQRLQPHMHLPGHACRGHQRISPLVSFTFFTGRKAFQSPLNSSTHPCSPLSPPVLFNVLISVSLTQSSSHILSVHNNNDENILNV